MKTRQTVLIGLALILLAFSIGIYLYPHLPDRIAAHWNAQGQVNGYMSKFWGLFFLPLLTLALLVLFTVLPNLDPLKDNIAEFRAYYNFFILLLVGFLVYLYVLMIFWNLKHPFRLPQYMAPALGALFYYTGVLLKRAQPNWFIGIRTPWTLSSERVWRKTHQLGGILYQAAGITAVLGVLTAKFAVWFAIAPVIAVSLYLVIYSYLEFRKENRKS